MPTQKKSKRAWLYLAEDDLTRLEKLVSALGTLSEAAVLSTLASAGLKACEKLGNRMPLPLRFQVVEGIPPDEKLESPPKSRHRFS